MTRDERLRRQWRLLQRCRAAGDHELALWLISEMARRAKTPADVALLTLLRQQCELEAIGRSLQRLVRRVTT